MTGRGLVTLGETMAMVRSQSPGSFETESALRLGIGGAESNVAIGVARLGTSSTWVGRVGNDSLGRRIHRELRAEAVDARVVVDERRATGLMIKESLTSASTRVVYYRAGSAGSALSADDVPVDAVTNAALLHVTGITPALSGTAASAVDFATRAATTAGVAISFDVNHRAALWVDRDPADVYRGLASRASVVFASPDEARLLVPDALTPIDLARGIASLGPTQVLIKLGADGCLALIDGVEYERSARSIAVVDTVGAGDAFVAGYLAELINGLSIDCRLNTAIDAGALACTSAGDWEGLPRRVDLAALANPEPVAR